MTENKSSILNRIFSRNTFINLINLSQDKIYNAVIEKYIKDIESKKNYEIISEIYSNLRENYRNEYFYKNTLLNKLLLGVYSVNTTTALTEVRVGKSIADFILINKKSMVFEIKTELDNLERLETQIKDYYKAFNYVSVVTHEKNLESLKEKLNVMNKPVGIYILRKSGKLSTICKPQEWNNDLDKEVMFKMLRKKEYERIIYKYYKKLPSVSQFKYYSECKKLFIDIPIEKSHKLVMKELKNRQNIKKKLFEQVPYEIKYLVYFLGLKDYEYEKLSTFLNKKYKGD